MGSFSYPPALEVLVGFMGMPGLANLEGSLVPAPTRLLSEEPRVGPVPVRFLSLGRIVHGILGESLLMYAPSSGHVGVSGGAPSVAV